MSDIGIYFDQIGTSYEIKYNDKSVKNENMVLRFINYVKNLMT